MTGLRERRERDTVDKRQYCQVNRRIHQRSQELRLLNERDHRARKVTRRQQRENICWRPRQNTVGFNAEMENCFDLSFPSPTVQFLPCAESIASLQQPWLRAPPAEKRYLHARPCLGSPK